MAPLYPLEFRPVFRRYVWGGRRLKRLLDKPLDDDDQVAESWEVVDHRDAQSIVAAGPLAGRTLHELMARDRHALLGPSAIDDSFPLLAKFLDAQQNLSVQVHPDDAQAARLDPPDRGKTEAWVVLQADPGSLVYAGLKRGFDRAALEREVNRGTTHLCLHAFTPRPGDCIFLPARTVHALGAGLVVAEIQQASDTTFRLFDWDRLGPDGQPRPLHVRQALDTIDFDRGPLEPQRPQPTERPHVERLVACEKFVLDRWQLAGREGIGDGRCFQLIIVLDGRLSLEPDPLGRILGRGRTVLLPAELGRVDLRARPRAELLAVTLPAVTPAPGAASGPSEPAQAE